MVICIILMGATVLQSAAHHCALDPVQSGDMIAMLKRVHGRPSHSCHDLPGQLLLVRSHVHTNLTPVLPMRCCDREAQISEALCVNLTGLKQKITNIRVVVPIGNCSASPDRR
jgi:hypothetical protein